MVALALGTGLMIASVVGTITAWIRPGGQGTQAHVASFASPVLAAAPEALAVRIDKTNDAAGTGYARMELAPAAGRDVPFRVVITNDSGVPAIIWSLSDSWSGQAPFTPACSVPVVGQVLSGNGGTTTCYFTVRGYSPPPGQQIVDTVTATLFQFDIQANSAVTANSVSVTSTSAVGTRSGGASGQLPTVPPQTAGTTPPRPPPAFAYTGPSQWTRWGFVTGLGLISAGFFTLWLTASDRTDDDE